MFGVSGALIEMDTEESSSRSREGMDSSEMDRGNDVAWLSTNMSSSFSSLGGLIRMSRDGEFLMLVDRIPSFRSVRSSCNSLLNSSTWLTGGNLCDFLPPAVLRRGIAVLVSTSSTLGTARCFDSTPFALAGSAGLLAICLCGLGRVVLAIDLGALRNGMPTGSEEGRGGEGEGARPDWEVFDGLVVVSSTFQFAEARLSLARLSSFSSNFFDRGAGFEA